MARELADGVFRHLDFSALREMGVGDAAVPKRIKKIAEAFARPQQGLWRRRPGRDRRPIAWSTLWPAMSTASEDLAGARWRLDLARFVREAATALDAAPLEKFMAGRVDFPAPALP